MDCCFGDELLQYHLIMDPFIRYLVFFVPDIYSLALDQQILKN